MRDIEKEYIDTKSVAEEQYDYIKVLEEAIKQNGIASENIQQVFDKLKSDRYENFKVSRSLDLNTIMIAVCKYYGVDKEDVLGKRRHRHIIIPRHIVCYIAKFYIPSLSLKTIGKYLGGRDHSTVIHGASSIVDDMSYNKTLRMEVNEIVESLKI
jgi:chromosomal replication initiation ATPase DnaA|tara:strand:+ start:1548 stop:2012 length:465 start_codon:yes stop_codon:yes gene_type:complete